MSNNETHISPTPVPGDVYTRKILVCPQPVPGAPVITSIEYSEQLLYITWSPPEEANGVILRYLVDIVSNGHHYTREYVTETEDVISDLPECTSYDITVTAETEPGSGPSAANSTFLSGSVAQSFVTCDLGDGDHARVCWKPCSQQCFTGDLNYNISWSSDVLWSDTEDSSEDSWPWENKDNSCYTLDSSVPYTNYSFCVGVVGQDTDTECCSVVTPQTDFWTTHGFATQCSPSEPIHGTSRSRTFLHHYSFVCHLAPLC
ncbi:uncharacterized protein [Cherax quadricarinatus]|uniref:uncharacterized protein isoform X1 n=1 Tax=Cherax quadricarinatus TaxID=27406 RepID=UPI00387EC24A